MSTQKVTANQLYKEYRRQGGTLAFKEWVTRENMKYSNADGVTSDQPIVKNQMLQDTINEMIAPKPTVNSVSGKTVFGIPKTALIVAAVIIGGAIAYKLYKDNQKNG